MNITGTEAIETEDGRIEVECDRDGVSLTFWERIEEGTYGNARHVRLSQDDWAAIERAVHEFAAVMTAAA